MAKSNVINIKEMKNITPEDVELIKSLRIIHTSWKDYTLLLLNSTPDPLRSIWREKVVTSLSHWNFNAGSISEGNLIGTEVLTVLPSDFTQMVVDDSFEPDGWYKMTRLAGSKRMKVFLGHYPQESISNEANLCMKYIVKNWDKYSNLIFNTPLLKRMWDLSQASGGKCLLPDEILTYILEKPVNDSIYGGWIDVAYDVFTNGIPSDKYKEYWKNDKIEGFPLAEYNPNSKEWYYTIKNSDGTVGHVQELTLEEQKQNFLSLCDIILKEDVSMSPCWKKIAICILKNDVSFKYAGFGSTLRERQAREEAIAAFSTKQEEKAKAKVEAERLANQIAKENKIK